MNGTEIRDLATALRYEISKGVVGQDDTVDLMLTALFSRGHILLEGAPGTAKTFLAQCFAAALGIEFGRIQFTPDLMPGDVLGTNLFDFKTSEFTLKKGPIFTSLLLADEINRTPPKTQAALLEAMQERTVTIDGTSWPLDDHFIVIATQNPIEQQGTYPLPEAQLDRFLFKHVLDYPTEAEELAIVTQHGARTGAPKPAELGIETVLTPDHLKAIAETVRNVTLTDDIVQYTVSLIRATRESSSISTGASPRAGAMLATAARAKAVLDGRDYVIPDDVKFLALPALRHRVVLSASAEIEGRASEDIVAGLVEQVTAPR